ncbi:hypothetical protein YPPY09_3569, partial [Yersinia pestis PY-09]
MLPKVIGITARQQANES